MAKSDSDSIRLVDDKPADKITNAVLDALAGGWTKAKAKPRRAPRSKCYYKDSGGRWHLDSDDPF